MIFSKFRRTYAGFSLRVLNRRDWIFLGLSFLELWGTLIGFRLLSFTAVIKCKLQLQQKKCNYLGWYFSRKMECFHESAKKTVIRG